MRRFELLVALGISCAALASTARADEDPLAPYRDRFRQGMEKYKAGAMAEAIRAWSAIYEEIGPQRGYRLSYNLARAYEANSETSRAAERYQSFLDEVAVRRKAGEALDDIVDREAREAQSRLDDLNANNGRIRILSGGRSVAAQIDAADPRLGPFVTYVAPGDHVVVFAPGSPDEERRDLSVKAGELVEVSPPPPPAAPLFPSLGKEVVKPRRIEVQHPFPAAVLYVGVGVTALSLVVPILTYSHAWSLINTSNSTAVSFGPRIIAYSEYSSARATAYATAAIPLALTAVTGTLFVYYLRGSKEREVTVGGGILPGGAALTLAGAV